MSVDVNNTQPEAEDLSLQKASANQENPPVTGTEANDEETSFEKLLEAYEGRTQRFSEGDVIRGRVIAISGSGVIVDVGFKSEGIIPIEQFTTDRGQVTIKAGDAIDVFLEQTEDSNGYVVLSREKAERMKIWDEIERAYKEGTVVKGRVIERIKGGLLVTGFHAPAGHHVAKLGREVGAFAKDGVAVDAAVLFPQVFARRDAVGERGFVGRGGDDVAM